MIKAMIVDDELHAREELATLLEEANDVEVIASCANALEAIKQVNAHNPQVLFLDIQMPMINGFELLSMIDAEKMPHVVFVTAYDQYALKAFEEKTLDYLLKPIDPDRLEKALEKLKATLESTEAPNYDLPQLNRVPCVSGHKIKLVVPQDIEMIHSDLSGVHVFTPDGNSYTELTLKVLEQQLGLQRCHKQYLVNLEHVAEIIPQENGQAELMMRSGRKVPVSRRYLRSVKDVFQL